MEKNVENLIRVKNDIFTQVCCGERKVVIFYGHRVKPEVGDAIIRNFEGSEIRVYIKRISYVNVKTITDIDVEFCGFDDRDSFRNYLFGLNPNYYDDDILTIVYFKI